MSVSLGAAQGQSKYICTSGKIDVHVRTHLSILLYLGHAACTAILLVCVYCCFSCLCETHGRWHDRLRVSCFQQTRSGTTAPTAIIACIDFSSILVEVYIYASYSCWRNTAVCRKQCLDTSIKSNRWNHNRDKVTSLT